VFATVGRWEAVRPDCTWLAAARPAGEGQHPLSGKEQTIKARHRQTCSSDRGRRMARKWMLAFARMTLQLHGKRL
jgi:hypothetical protein